jgi:hypothetical protein
VQLDAWIYYGPHPYMMAGVPLWCPMTYSAFLMTISFGLYAMATQLPKRHHWLIVFGLPLCMAGGHCATALPTAAAMFSTTNPAWIWLGGTASIALSLMLVHIASLVFCVPAAQRQTSPAGVARVSRAA